MVVRNNQETTRNHPLPTGKPEPAPLTTNEQTTIDSSLLKHYAISFFPDHARFTPYPYSPKPGAVSIPTNPKFITPHIEVSINGITDNFLIDTAGAANMVSRDVAKRCGLHKFPNGREFHTTDSRGSLILQSYHNVPVQIKGLPTITTTLYETIPNGIYGDNQGLTSELFTAHGYVVTLTNREVIFEYLNRGFSTIPNIRPSYRPVTGETLSSYGKFHQE
jgi:hypothetical protein